MGKRFFLVGLVCCIFMNLIGCCKKSSGPALDKIPANVDMLIRMNISAIRNDKDIMEALNAQIKKKEKKNLGELLQQKAGFNLSELTELVVGINFKSEKPEALVAIKSVNKDDVIAAFQKNMQKQGKEFKSTTFEGKTIYFPDKRDEGKALYFENDICFFGNRSMIKLIGQNSVKEVKDLINCFSSLNETNVLAVALKVTKRSRKLMKIPPMIPQDLKFVSLFLGKSGKELSLAISGNFNSEKSAENVKSLLTTFLMMGTAKAPPDIKKLLNNLKIEAESKTVKIGLTLNFEDLKALKQGSKLNVPFLK